MNVSIVIGDLFDFDDHLVIGMSDTFDTETPVIIAAQSVQGQFLARVYRDDRAALDQDLSAALRGRSVIASESRSSRPKGKLERYPIGTVAVLGDVQRHYFCVAYSRMSNEHVAHSTVSDVWYGLCATWEAVRDRGQGRPVSMPVAGSGMARLSSQIGREDLVKLILLSFLTASRQRVVTSQLRIVVHPADAARMDLRELADLLQAQ